MANLASVSKRGVTIAFPQILTKIGEGIQNTDS